MPPSSPRPSRRPDPATPQLSQRRLERFRHSGLPLTALCDSEGITTAPIYYWPPPFLAHPTPPTADTGRLVPIRLVTPPVGRPVELLLPSGVVLRLSPDADLAWLRELLGLLGVARC